MNRNEVINELAEFLSRWPSNAGNIGKYDGWSWVDTNKGIHYCHPLENDITEQDWLAAKDRQIPEGTERVYSDGDAKVFMKLAPNFYVQTFASGVWRKEEDQNYIAELWDQAEKVAEAPSVQRFTYDQALISLINNLKEWPISSISGTNFPMGWSWVECVGSIFLRSDDGIQTIACEDWEREMKEQRRMNVSIKMSPTPDDQVHQPKHYSVVDGVESIQLIASGLTRDEWRGFCMGNIMKYRFRAGKKDVLEQDIAKANEYETLFEKYKELNRNDRF